MRAAPHDPQHRAQRLLQDAVGAAIARAPDASLAERASEDLDWEAFLALAADNRLVVLARRGLDASRASVPAHVATRMGEYQNATAAWNAANFAVIRELCPALDAAGVAHALMKGPLAQKRLYGDYFVKPSTDVDLLVDAQGYARARDVLEDLGWRLSPLCDTAWWRVFLGEQHFSRSTAPYAAIIDLHFRMQQPGSPAPRRPRDFMRTATATQLGETGVRVFAPEYACLHASMSLVKALMHREAAGGYGADIAAFVRTRDEVAMQRLHDLAREQGLALTLALGLAAASSLFGAHAPGRARNARQPLAGLTDIDLADMVLAPARLEGAWPARTKMLWALMDAKINYPHEVIWSVASEACRQIIALAAPAPEFPAEIPRSTPHA